MTRARMRDATITPYVVSSGYLGPNGAPTSFEAGLKLAGEYTKFLLARVKVFIPGSGR